MTLWRLVSLSGALRSLHNAGVRAALGLGRLLQLRPAPGAGVQSSPCVRFTLDRLFDRGAVGRAATGRWLQLGGLEAQGCAYDWSRITVTRRVLEAGRLAPDAIDAGRRSGDRLRMNWPWCKVAAMLRGAAGPPGVRTAPC